MTTFYANQIKAANEIYENFFNLGATTVILSAECQAGKTGVLQVLIDKLYTEAPPVHVFAMVPSNTPLREQTEERLFSSDKALIRTVSRRVHHAADIYRAGPRRDALVREIKAILELGEQVLVVWDEAHIGAGTTKKKDKITKEVEVEWQKIPALFDELFGGIPGCAAAQGVRYLAITATPFDWDYYIAENPRTDTAEVILDAGSGYIGLRELRKLSRLRPHLKRGKAPRHEREKEDRRFRALLLALVKELAVQETPKYLVFRCTTTKERAWFRIAAEASGLPYREFSSKNDTIGEFEKTLQTPPEQTQALGIIQSFKEGQTICQDYIGAWYENDTKAGRNHADIYQSVGRCMGYFDSESVPSYPIFVDIEVADMLTDYIDCMYRRDFTGKRKFPTTTTHKKVKCTQKEDSFCVAYDTLQEAKKDYVRRRGQPMGKWQPRKVSKQKHDVITELRRGTDRQNTSDLVNIRVCDGPSYTGAHQSSWDNTPEWHGKYIILYRTGKMVTEVVVKSTAMHSKLE